MTDRTPYDSSYKLLFSHPDMVRDLLLGFFPDLWVKELDFSTLERVNVAFQTENLKEREGDIIWKLQFREQWVYVYCLIEPQSTVDKFMAARLLAYIGLLYLDIVKQDASVRASGQLPPVLPIVLYSGRYRWTVPLSLREILDSHIPEKLKRYQPDLHYWVLDEGHYPVKDDILMNNLAAPLIALERAKKRKDVSEVLRHLVEQLKSPAYDSLRRAYVVYLNRTLKIKKLSKGVELNELYEVQQMLAERVDQWIETGVEKGRKKGMKEGRKEGMEKGMEKGTQAAQIRIAKNILAEGSDPAFVAKMTKLKLNTVLKLQSSLPHAQQEITD